MPAQWAIGPLPSPIDKQRRADAATAFAVAAPTLGLPAMSTSQSAARASLVTGSWPKSSGTIVSRIARHVGFPGLFGHRADLLGSESWDVSRCLQREADCGRSSSSRYGSL